MTPTRSHLIGAAKLAFALLIIGATTAVASQQLMPTVPLSTLLVYAIAGLLALFVIAAIGLALSLTFRQAVLRKGGTDTQWLWFTSEPEGLVALRRRKSDQPLNPEL